MKWPWHKFGGLSRNIVVDEDDKADYRATARIYNQLRKNFEYTIAILQIYDFVGEMEILNFLYKSNINDKIKSLGYLIYYSPNYGESFVFLY